MTNTPTTTSQARGFIGVGGGLKRVFSRNQIEQNVTPVTHYKASFLLSLLARVSLLRQHHPPPVTREEAKEGVQ